MKEAWERLAQELAGVDRTMVSADLGLGLRAVMVKALPSEGRVQIIAEPVLLPDWRSILRQEGRGRSGIELISRGKLARLENVEKMLSQSVVLRIFECQGGVKTRAAMERLIQASERVWVRNTTAYVHRYGLKKVMILTSGLNWVSAGMGSEE